ncbi:MAG: hypothetical protein D3905_14645 [Candidatus Electrothrix sp. AS4_5]|nr:hypothetical protein [Candidatus Electrothrix gigas]
MEKIGELQEDIYNFFHGNEACKNFFYDAAQEERYAAYYTSMYLLQDTTESLFVHRKKGFSDDAHQAYIEFWGVMQAIIIQQDSIYELHKAVKGNKLKTKSLTSWRKLRFFRNTCAGHPAKRDRPSSKPLVRTFMGRNFGGYSSITYEKWEESKPKDLSSLRLGSVSHPRVALGDLIDAYEKEAVNIIENILKFMKRTWPDIESGNFQADT